jgi:hypothetical protein
MRSTLAACVVLSTLFTNGVMAFALLIMSSVPSSPAMPVVFP